MDSEVIDWLESGAGEFWSMRNHKRPGGHALIEEFDIDCMVCAEHRVHAVGEWAPGQTSTTQLWYGDVFYEPRAYDPIYSQDYKVMK